MLKNIFVVMFAMAVSKAEYDLDEMASSACIGLSVGQGKTVTVVPVRRQCSNLAASCDVVCQNAPAFSNGAANVFSCFDALHVYQSRPTQRPAVGQVTHFYDSFTTFNNCS